MALLDNNILGGNSLMSPGGQLATSANFIDPYTYAQQYQPELLAKLHLKHGKGRITKFSALVGNEESYASDQVKHSELGRLHQTSEEVAVSGDEFTCGEAHNLRVNDVIMISDGTIEKHAIVSGVTSPTVFVAENSEAGAFGFTGAVSLFTYSNSWNKGEENFKVGRQWDPEIITNHTHIIKEFYSINESDMAHITWIKAPQYPGGEAWTNIEMGRTNDLYDNNIELTHIFNRRADTGSAYDLAGKAKGMKGFVQQTEERGNIGNEYITTKEQLYDIAFRLKQQGGCRVATVWADHQQMVYFNEIAAALNANHINGGNYGVFPNGKDMAIMLDFKTLSMAGVTFHITPLTVLDDPTLLGASKFTDTSIACMIIPSGDTMMMEDGNTYSKPYLCTKYRRMGGLNRYRKVDIFGGQIGTPHKVDTMEALYTTEQTNQVIGANNFFVYRRGTGIYN